MRVISFYTEGDGGSYGEEGDILVASLDRFGIAYHIENREAWGDWYDHTAFKAEFIRAMRKKYDGPLLWIDADAVLHSDPTAYFQGLANQGYDFGVHFFRGPGKGHDRTQVRERGWRLLSGTTFWGDTPRARKLLDAWVDLNETLRRSGIREGGGQKNLWYLTTCFKRLRVKRIPGRYCFVHDKPWAYPENEPRIIEHTIASRAHRPVSQDKPLKERRYNESREKRIKELREEMEGRT